MGLKLFVFLFMVLVLMPFAQAQEGQIGVITDGSCVDYEVTLTLDDYENGYYDVKIDIFTPEGSRIGEIYDPIKGWKSSYYYVEDAIKIQGDKNYETFKIRANTHKDFTIQISIRKDSSIWKSGYHEIKQDCPEIELIQPPLFLMAVMITVLILVAGIALYIRKFS